MPLFQGRNVILAEANQFSRFMSEKAIGIRLLNTLSTFIAAALMMTSTLASAQTEGIVSGIVTDESGPVIGASAIVRSGRAGGTAGNSADGKNINGTVTDINGEFTLSSVPRNAVIEISCLG